MVARWLTVNYLEDNIDDKQLLLGVYMTVFSPFGGCQLSSALPGTCQDVCRSLYVAAWESGGDCNLHFSLKVNYPLELGDEVRT